MHAQTGGRAAKGRSSRGAARLELLCACATRLERGQAGLTSRQLPAALAVRRARRITLTSRNVKNLEKGERRRAGRPRSAQPRSGGHEGLLLCLVALLPLGPPCVRCALTVACSLPCGRSLR